MELYIDFGIKIYMKLHIPNSAFLGNMDTFIRSYSPLSDNSLEITFNKSWMSVHPLVLSMTAALALQIKQNGGKIDAETPEATSKHYLDRMGLFKFLGIPSLSIREHEPAGRFIAITQITDTPALTKFITDMIPLLHTDRDQSMPIEYVISELVRNVFEHAQTNVGAIVCAQFFKKTNRVSIGVADAGVGIRRTIQVSHHAPDDASAIKLALTPGITGSTKQVGGTEANAGAGLFFIKSIAKVNRDYFLIYSGNAMYKLLKTPAGKAIRLYANPMEDRYSMHADFPSWHGTAVGIDISVDKTQKFNELLDMIRQIYRIDTT